MKKYNVSLNVILLERIYEIESKNAKQAFEIAKQSSEYHGNGGIELFEIEEIR